MNFFYEIEEACCYIEKLFDQKSLEEFRNSSYDELCFYHLTLGLWVRNHLLYRESPLYNVFTNAGVHQKDDMSSLMIRLFYIYMNTKKVSS